MLERHIEQRKRKKDFILQMHEEGFLKFDSGKLTIKLTDKGFNVMNSIIVELIS